MVNNSETPTLILAPSLPHLPLSTCTRAGGTASRTTLYVIWRGGGRSLPKGGGEANSLVLCIMAQSTQYSSYPDPPEHSEECLYLRYSGLGRILEIACQRIILP